MPEPEQPYVEKDPHRRMWLRLSKQAELNGADPQTVKNLHDMGTWFGTRNAESERIKAEELAACAAKRVPPVRPHAPLATVAEVLAIIRRLPPRSP